jgi:hypothetical protein
MRDYSAPKITVTEQGEEALTLSLEQLGYTIDETELLERITACMDDQNKNLLMSLLQGNTFEVKIPFTFDEEVFEKAVSSANLKTPRFESVDASMEYNGKEYYIEPEVYGNEFDDADLRVMVKDLADRIVSADRPQDDGSVDIPESFYYVPAVTQDDSEMNTMMNLYNSFCKAKITLTFGKEEKVIDWSTIRDWLIIEDGEASVNDEPVYEYVYDLAANYDTLYYSREFVTHDGNTITYESSDYGYQIDKEAEAQQLIADIYSNTTVERDPIYAVKGYKRNGRDDICGNYVEVNLTTQHLWFYREGKLVTETDIVSGLPTEKRETATGVFMIPYKESPKTLVGDTWSADVTYWMPFYDGQGLHDASWRSTFGGTISQTDGSHGCVNLPSDKAKNIYDNMQERMPIFLYK